jgi:hypothetical protein
MTGLSRRRSRVRVPSLPLFVQAVLRLTRALCDRELQAVHKRLRSDNPHAPSSGERPLAQVTVE